MNYYVRCNVGSNSLMITCDSCTENFEFRSGLEIVGHHKVASDIYRNKISDELGTM